MGSNTALMDNAAALPRGLAVSDERRGGSEFGSDEAALSVSGALDDPMRRASSPWRSAATMMSPRR